MWRSRDGEKGIIGLLRCVRCRGSVRSVAKNCCFHTDTELLMNSSPKTPVSFSMGIKVHWLRFVSHTHIKYICVCTQAHQWGTRDQCKGDQMFLIHWNTTWSKTCVLLSLQQKRDDTMTLRNPQNSNTFSILKGSFCLFFCYLINFWFYSLKHLNVHFYENY